MSAYLSNPRVWQESWDRQQQAFLPDREERFAAMLEAVAATTEGSAPRVLDLAGGTGTISLRTLARFPGARVTVLDQDPVLMAIASASLRDRGTVVDADLGDPGWRAKLPEEGFDAVLTATALHWLPAERVAALYGEVREVLRPGGIFVNADHMPEESLPTLSERLRDHGRAEREARYAAGAATSWGDWWARAAADEFLAPKAVERERIYPQTRHSQEWTPPALWHVDALRVAGFSEAGVLWRGGTDAAVVGLR
ncbi:class I SAM-dependent methyltransferase [Actinoplanes sp. LDG1-06]|uniref:Class I SAM-dependent methyltransferase n=1 Tax=Paractinoplanes ovalisporus TaxID=2810368 RepID=A0ABS2AP31_9ACTN|nr:class I SAM-dependent methyltransferase [Actinoplanes ovalisporus]MBM2621585.1 class I SAM-dependent methyltransferase [Actinoplanes ovalisporus]